MFNYRKVFYARLVTVSYTHLLYRERFATFFYERLRGKPRREERR